MAFVLGSWNIRIIGRKKTIEKTQENLGNESGLGCGRYPKYMLIYANEIHTPLIEEDGKQKWWKR